MAKAPITALNRAKQPARAAMPTLKISILTACRPDIEALIAELGEKLEAAGLLDDGDPVPGTYPAAQTQAAWNWIYIVLEDKSLGVHNPAFTKAMLEAGLAAFE